MGWFRCQMRGVGIPGDMFGETGLVGFHVVRFVVAADAAAAESAAVQMLRSEPKLKPPPGYKPSGQAQVFVDVVEEVSADGVLNALPGFAWYLMDDPD